jgi:hypothetical protein
VRGMVGDFDISENQIELPSIPEVVLYFCFESDLPLDSPAASLPLYDYWRSYLAARAQHDTVL